jgi:Zn-dependent peptidase ImmA (M78 family)
VTAESEGRAAAEQFRSEYRLGHQPLGNLVALIEQTAEIDVTVVKATPDEHGMAMRDPARGRVFVAVAKTPHPMRQRSTLAHELAHVLFGDWDDTASGGRADRSFEEVRADAFARHLLVPEAGLKELFAGRRPVGLAGLSTVVQRFLVSPAMAAIALQRAGLIDEATGDTWRQLTTPVLAARFGWTDQYQGLREESDRTRAPQRLLARATLAYTEQVVPVETLARLRDVKVSEVQAELEAAGLVPHVQPPAWAGPDDLPQVEVDLSDLDDMAEDRS